MVSKVRNQAAHEKPAAQPSGLAALNTIAALVAVTAATLAAGAYVWRISANVEQLKGDFQEANIGRISANVEQLKGDFQEANIGRISANVEQLKGDFQEANIGQLQLAADVKQLKDNFQEAKSTNTKRTLPRIDALEARLSKVSDYLKSETFDTVYVFKHTFNFPNPMFNVTDNEEARFLACPSGELDVDWATEELLGLERHRYQKELATFDDNIEFKFYTMSNEPKTIIRQEIACYKNEPRENEDISISPAPVKVIMQMESAKDGDDSYGIFRVSADKMGFDHDNPSDLMTYPLRRMPDTTGRQVHKLAATLVDREHKDGSQRDCYEYKRKAATGELDRCDFEVFVFAYDTPLLQ